MSVNASTDFKTLVRADLDGTNAESLGNPGGLISLPYGLALLLIPEVSALPFPYGVCLFIALIFCGLTWQILRSRRRPGN